MRNFLFILFFFSSSLGHAALTNSDIQALQFQNLIANGGFENNKASWTAASNTFTIDSTNFIVGKASGLMTMSAQTGTLTNTVTPTIQTNGVNMEASCSVKTTLTTAQVCAMANGVELSCTNAPFSGNWSNIPVNFVGPTNGQSVGVRVKTSASATGTITVDDCYVGKARNVGTVAQAQLYGAVNFPKTTSCIWNTTSTTYASYTAVAACTLPSGTGIIGNAQAPATKIPAITFASLPPGEYKIEAVGLFSQSVSAGNIASFRFSDGTNAWAGENPIQQSGASSSGVPMITARFTYSTAQTNVTIQIQGETQSGTGAIIDVASLNSLQINLYYIPSTLQQVVSVNQGPFFTDWQTYTMTVGASTSAGTKGTTTNDKARWRRVGDTMEISYEYTQTAAGTVGSGTYLFPLPSGYTVDTNKTTLSSAGIVAAVGAGNASTNSDTIGVNTLRLIVTPRDASNLALYTTATSSTNVQTNMTAVGSATLGFGNTSLSYSFFARVPITGWTAPSVPVPILVGSVSSNSVGAERIERASITNNGTTCVASSQSGSWISSLVRNAAGKCTATIASGLFSAAPACTYNNVSGGAITMKSDSSTTTTSFTFTSYNTGSSTATDANVDVICMGPR